MIQRFTFTSSSDAGLETAILLCTSGGDVAGAAVTAPKAVIQLVHGMCEHKERYIPFMEFMAANGYACVIHDHIGHGESVKSAEDLGFFYAGGWNTMIEDIRLVNEWIKQRFLGVPVFLFGHSMGSMAVRSYVKRYDDTVSALFVCGCPAFNPGSVIGKAVAKVTGQLCGYGCRPGFIQKMAFGSYGKKFKGESSPNCWVCSDPEVVKEYDADPLCNYVFTANGFYNLFSLMGDCYDTKGWKVSSPDMPVRFISGLEDPCLIDVKHFESAVDAMRKVGYRNVGSRLYPGMRHEILNEKDKMTVWNDVLSFADSFLEH